MRGHHHVNPVNCFQPHNSPTILLLLGFLRLFSLIPILMFPFFLLLLLLLLFRLFGRSRFITNLSLGLSLLLVRLVRLGPILLGIPASGLRKMVSLEF